MKRRLHRAYDHMTMPDGCTQRIEQRLTQELQAKKEGRYLKAVSPAPVRRNGWAAAVVAICLVLVLSVGGTALILRTSETVMDRPAETAVTTEPMEPTENVMDDVSLQQNRQQANALFLEVLSGKRGFFRENDSQETTITEYTKERTEDMGKEITIPFFTMVDMDRDGVKELILQIRIADDPIEDYLILRYDPYDNDEGGMVYTFMEPQQKITDLKKDGTFYWRGGGGQGEAFMALDGSNGQYYVSSSSFTEGVPAEWHAYPCVRPELVIASYEYAGTGQTRLPGNPYYTFETLIRGEAGNNWESHKEQLTRWGMICLEEEGTVTVFDPDAPGCCLFGTLTNENGFLQFADIGYYISNEYGEREAKVLGLLSENLQYIAGSHLEDLDAYGREVDRLEALLEYLS